MNVLLPLAERYAWWLTRPAPQVNDVSDEDPELVRAMPIVLRIEKATPPSRTPLLEAAAAAAIAVCADPRAEEEGKWHDEVAAWIDGRIRKVSRRARGAHWEAVQARPGVTVRVGDAEARALLPWRVVETPHEVRRLQITGSDLPLDSPGPAPAGVPVLWVNPDVPMSAGKAAAQVGHATMLLAALLPAEELSAWQDNGFRCAVRTPEPAVWKQLVPGEDPAAAWRERGVVAVRDAGFTEVAPGTVTVVAAR